MRSWPSLQDYNKALAPENLHRSLKLAGFEGAQIQTNVYGIPAAISGGFAYIYQLTLKDGSKKALRLFHSAPETRIPCMEAAYGLAAHIAERQDPLAAAFIEAYWINNGFYIEDIAVPAIIMDWIDEPVLASWIEKQYRNRDQMRALRKKLCKLQSNLEAFQIVHGDIQANNIAITKHHDPILLDYDSLGLRNTYDSRWEQGHIHFQHPDENRHVNGIDRFPFLVIDLGLAILEEEPDLFDTYSQGENILFTADDFYNPHSSQLLAAAAAIPSLTRACELFTSICEGPSNAVPTLEEFHEKTGIQLEDTTETEAVNGPQEIIKVQMEATQKKAVTETRPRKTAARESKSYRPVYPVYAAPSFLSMVQENGLHNTKPYLESLPIIGQKIELIGQIHEVKKGRTKYKDPYVFVNFNDWRRGGIKLIFWSEALDTFGDQAPNDFWEGCWVSATGMVDEPYESRSSFPQFSITINDPSQIRLITSKEATRRLAAAQALPTPSAATGPASLTATSGRVSPAARRNAAAQLIRTPALQTKELGRPSNADLLRQLEQEMKAPVSTQSSSLSEGSPLPATSSSQSSGCIWFLLVLLGMVLWIMLGR